jgi:hypothetical protein
MTSVALNLLGAVLGFAVIAAADNGSVYRRRQVDGQRIEVGATTKNLPTCDDPESWGWGADGECPHDAIVQLRILRDGQRVLVPRSAYADLAGLRLEEINIVPETGGFVVLIKGGDAATSYTAELHFTVSKAGVALSRRVVRSGEFHDEAWEATTYTWNVGEEPPWPPEPSPPPRLLLPPPRH